MPALNVRFVLFVRLTGDAVVVLFVIVLDPKLIDLIFPLLLEKREPVKLKLAVLKVPYVIVVFEPVVMAEPSVHVAPIPVTVQLEFSVNPFVVNV